MFWNPPEFKRARYRSRDTATPKAHVLDDIAARMAAEGWKQIVRAEGAKAVLALGWRNRGLPSDPGLCRIAFEKTEGSFVKDAGFLVYDHPRWASCLHWERRWPIMRMPGRCELQRR